MPHNSDCASIVWIIGSPLAFFRRDAFVGADLYERLSHLLADHNEHPDTALGDLGSYGPVMHHFTEQVPETSHHGILSAAEVAELRCQAKIERKRVASVGPEGRIALSNGEHLHVGPSAVVVTCTGPMLPDEQAVKRAASHRLAMRTPVMGPDSTTLYPLLADYGVPRSNHFVSRSANPTPPSSPHAAA